MNSDGRRSRPVSRARSELLVSILTPTFGHARYIVQCLESARAQTHRRWELFVVDDGSDDGTGDLVRSIADERIRYLRLPHRGILSLAASYNLALRQSRGEFVAVLEGDDFWPADKLERQLPAFDRPEVVLTWGRAAVTDEGGDVSHLVPSIGVITSMAGLTRGETASRLLRGNSIPACTAMCRRDALVRIGGFQQPDGMPTADYPTWLELCRVGSVAPVNAVLGYYRRHPAQATVVFEPAMNLVEDWGTIFVQRLPDAERAALGLSVRQARRIARRRRAYLLYGAGRRALSAGNRPLAQASFRQSLRLSLGVTGMKALVGLVCAMTGLDLEAVAGAFKWIA